MHKGKYLLLLTLLISNLSAAAQVDWARSKRMSADTLNSVFFKESIDPQWIDGSSYLTYNQKVGGACQYYIVSASGDKQPLIKDNDDFCRQYAALTGDTTIKANDIRLWGISLRDNSPLKFYFTKAKKHLVYDRTTGKLAIDKDWKEEKEDNHHFSFDRGTTTTDKRFTMMGRNFDLYVKDNNTGRVTRITDDGKEGAAYTSRGAIKDSLAENYANGKWYRHIFISTVYDDSEVKDLYVIHAVEGHRPILQTKKMPLPNESGVRRYRMLWYNADTGEKKMLPINRYRDGKVSQDYVNSLDTLWFTSQSRGVDSLQLCRIDIPTGKVTTVITEITKPHLNNELINHKIISGGREILWWSERTGRGNYYLYDCNGKLKNRITRGDNLVAGRIENIDEKNRNIIFIGYGQEKSSDPCYTYYYIASLDGKKQRLLTPGDGMHELKLSKDLRYGIDTYSRMDLAPVYQAVDVEKGKAVEFARRDTKCLEALGWKAPKLVKVKAADEKTDLCGVMYLPSNFEATKKYPIISNVYPGPQDDQLPRRFTLDDNDNQQLAELGFIVINVAPRGSSPWRGRDFYCFSYGNLRDYALADDKHTIESLAAQYPFIDLSRVGIYGHSGGGFMTATEMLTYPDFYKVGVAASGNYDNNNYIQWWGETYHGLVPQDSIPTTMQLAKNLKGKLMLISGDEDDNVPWTSTLRLVLALQDAGKRFDMMVLPGKDHGVYTPYYPQLIRRYFVDNLLKPTPRDANMY